MKLEIAQAERHQGYAIDLRNYTAIHPTADAVAAVVARLPFRSGGRSGLLVMTSPGKVVHGFTTVSDLADAMMNKIIERNRADGGEVCSWLVEAEHAGEPLVRCALVTWWESCWAGDVYTLEWIRVVTELSD